MESHKQLHWLPIKARIYSKILLLIYKALHDQIPEYPVNILVKRVALSERERELWSDMKTDLLYIS